MRTCVWGMVIALMVIATARAELMTNGGFESCTTGWYLSAGNYPDASINVVEDAAGAQEGLRYLKTSGTGVFEIAKTSATSLANTTYRMTMWIYPSEDCSDTLLEIGMQGWTNTFGVTVGSPSLVKGQWNKIQTTYTTGDSGITFQPHIYVWGLTSGTLAFDNIQVSTIQISPKSLTLGVEGGQADCSISPASVDYSWSAQVTTGTEWLSISSGSNGVGDGTLVVTCAENMTVASDPRVGTITITDSTGTTELISISQNSPVDAVDYPAELMTNGGFELGAEGWYLWAENYPGSSMGVVSDVAGAYEGSQYLVTSGTGAFEIGKMSTTSLANTTYRMTMWIYPSLDCSDTYLEIGMQGWTNSVGVTVGTSSLVKGQWNKIQTTYTTGASGIDFQPHVYVWGLSSGTLAFDDISVATLQVSPASEVMDIEGGEIVFDVLPVIQETSWVADVTEGGDWLSIAAGGSGYGDGVVTLSCAENTVASDDHRIGVVRISSGSGLAYFNVSQSSPAPIFDLPFAQESVMVDGILNEWIDADWIAMDENYDGDATDVIQAYYAAKWNKTTNKIYVAVKVEDNAHKFTSDYSGWADRDAVEVYIHTTAIDNVNYHSTQDSAQQWVVGMKAGTTDDVWTSLSDTGSVPSSSGLSAAGIVDENWIYYEMELTPFDYFGGLAGGTDSISPLAVTQQIGLDVCVISNDGSSTVGLYDVVGYTGMKGENTKIGKSNDWTQFRLHELSTIPGDASLDGVVDVGDLGILAANYGLTSGATWGEGDFTGDGAVDVGDLGILAANYGAGTSSGCNFDADYAKVFGTASESAISDELTDDDIDSTFCSSLGLPLIAGLMLMGFALAKLEE